MRWATFQIHFYSGLGIGLILLLLGASGSAIAFKDGLEFEFHNSRLFKIKLGAAMATSLQQTLDRLKREYSAYEAGDVSGFDRSDGILRVRLRSVGHDGSDREVFIDRQTGQELTGHENATRWLEILEDFHKNLLMGKRGRAVNGLIAFLFFLLVCSGLVIWWPGTSRWKRGLKVDLNLSWKRINYDFHSALGILCWAFLLIQASTALLLATPDLFRNWSNQREDHHHREGKDRGGDRPANSNVASVDSILSGISSNILFTGWELQALELPEHGGSYRAEFKQSSLVMSAQIDPSTLRVISRGNQAPAGLWPEMHDFMEAVHFGRLGGPWTQLLWVFLGLSPGLLAITGFFMWWNRVHGKQFNAPRRKIGPEAVRS